MILLGQVDHQAAPPCPASPGRTCVRGGRAVSQPKRERRTPLPAEPPHTPRPGGLGRRSPSPSRAIRDAAGVTDRGRAGDTGFPVATGWGALSWASEQAMGLGRTATCSSWGPLALSDPWPATLHPPGWRAAQAPPARECRQRLRPEGHSGLVSQSSRPGHGPAPTCGTRTPPKHSAALPHPATPRHTQLPCPDRPCH